MSSLSGLALAGTLALVVHAPKAYAEQNAGAYLAGRFAANHGDYPTAAMYFEQALMLDPTNAFLAENTIAAMVSTGRIVAATPLAESARAHGIDSHVATMVTFADAAEAGKWDRIFAGLEGGASIGPLLDGLAQGWAFVGLGDRRRAESAFDTVAEESGLATFGLYHKALALTVLGDDAAALEILSLPPQAGLHRTRRGAILKAEVLGRLGREAEAIDYLDATFAGRLDPGLQRLRDALAEGAPAGSVIATSAAEGLAEAYFSVGSAIQGQVDDGYALLYFRLARHLAPAHAEATLRVAGLLDDMGRHGLASAAYSTIGPRDPAYQSAALGRAEALRKAGEREAAADLLGTLCQTYESPRNRARLGDVLRQLGRFGEANEAYSRSLALSDEDNAARWMVHYARGITFEQMGDWDRAEADFRAALALNPGQPQVLNYLGYSLAEKNIKLDEALTMIRAAAEARPEDGRIADSLGWVLFRMGAYEEAVVQLERAAELAPTQSVVVDHLADAYWAVGRRTEARFQWRRALSFSPAEESAARIRTKLDHGLDLAQGGSAPEAVQVAHGDRQ
ncbi:tetratricopeptide repeat protein [Roseisalinus antarcticus]|uniref:Lipoprotein NlpI n=1 Tax=Roseisalinus antarcticus TaxID=254357 RepID=A0A1Y5RS30_9RHOB|nr:tetratricopeptide repeat protein [Roseisalinus antarcticus]SLN21311.1 lipoprotein NlpI [Roseisalinus antarcticus]